MQRSLLAAIGLVTQILCFAAIADDKICLESQLECTAITQVKQQPNSGQDSGSMIGLVSSKGQLFKSTLSAEDIDELFESNKAEKHKNQIKFASRSSHEEYLSAKDAELGEKIARAARIDCRKKYVSPEPNLLLIIPLLVETVTGTGCKW